MPQPTLAEELLRGYTDAQLKEELSRRKQMVEEKEFQEWLKDIRVIHKNVDALLELTPGHRGTPRAGDNKCTRDDECCRCTLLNIKEFGIDMASRSSDAAPGYLDYAIFTLSMSFHPRPQFKIPSE